MNDQPPESDLDRAIAEYLQLHAEPPTWLRQLLAQPALFPQFADFLRDEQALNQALPPLEPVADAQLQTAIFTESNSRSTFTAGSHPTGSTISGYEIRDEIARGAMGVVFRAVEVNGGRTVALKMILTGKLAREEDLRRFREEAEAAAGLEHPNIVPIYHVGQADGLPFYTMKYLTGGSLKAHIERLRADPPAAARLMITVSRAIHYAHMRGILHRDLKPANILLDENGVPYVSDFGLAKRLNGPSGELTASGNIVGTPAYMAPEQARGDRQITIAADVYALGAMLYELLTGRLPFGPADDILEALRRVREDMPPRLRSFNPSLPLDLEIICLKCLNKDPAGRYGTAEALASDLERWLAGEPIKARRVGLTERLWLWAKRNPLAASLTVTAAVLIGLAGWATVAIAQNREATLRREVCEANAVMARHVAGTILYQLERYAQSILQTARSPRLHRILRNPRHPDELRDFLASQFRNRGDAPFENLYLLNPDGRLIAIYPVISRIEGRSFAGRDYFRGARRRDAFPDLAGVHLSRVYKSENDGRYKFGLSVAVWEPEDPESELLGVLVATMTTDATLGLPNLHDARRKAIVIAPVDTASPNRSESESREEFRLLVHPLYAHGAAPLLIPSAVVPRFKPDTFAAELSLPLNARTAVNAEYEDPLGQTNREFAGRWLAGFAPLGNTSFVIGIQSRHEPDKLVYVFAAVSLGGLLLGVALWLASPRR